MEKRQQHSSPLSHPKPDAHYDLLGAKIEIASKANGVDAPKKQPLRQEELDRQALERAENEGMGGAPPARKPAAPEDRPTAGCDWLGFRMNPPNQEL